jgi:hypothetical protein
MSLLLAGAACSGGGSSPPGGVAMTVKDVRTPVVHFTVEIPKTWTVHAIPAEATKTRQVFSAESPDGPLFNVSAGPAALASITEGAAKLETTARQRAAKDVRRTTLRIDGESAVLVSYDMSVGTTVRSTVLYYLVRHGTNTYLLSFGGPGALDVKLADFMAKSVRFK